MSKSNDNIAFTPRTSLSVRNCNGMQSTCQPLCPTSSAVLVSRSTQSCTKRLPFVYESCAKPASPSSTLLSPVVYVVWNSCVQLNSDLWLYITKATCSLLILCHHPVGTKHVQSMCQAIVTFLKLCCDVRLCLHPLISFQWGETSSSRKPLRATSGIA